MSFTDKSTTAPTNLGRLSWVVFGAEVANDNTLKLLLGFSNLFVILYSSPNELYWAQGHARSIPNFERSVFGRMEFREVFRNEDGGNCHPREA